MSNISNKVGNNYNDKDSVLLLTESILHTNLLWHNIEIFNIS